MHPYLAMIVPVFQDAGSLPGFGGGIPSQPHPGGGPIYHPGHPDHGLPVQPGHPGNRPPGSSGGPVDPGWGVGDPGHPDHGLPSTPQPKAAVPESDIPPHPDKPDPSSDGEWILVALGDGTVGWAWMPAPPSAGQPK